MDTHYIYKEPIEKGLIGYAVQLGKGVDELIDDEATDIEGARNFFESNPGMEIKYNFLRDEYEKTLDGIDREIYYLSEQGYKQKEITKKLGYKNHSAVSNRMKKINKDFQQFLGFE